MAITEIVTYINPSIIAVNKSEFLSTISERYKQVYLAQEDAAKDVVLTLFSHLPKYSEHFLMISNIQANATKKTVVWKVRSMPFEHAADLAKAITQSNVPSIRKCGNKLRKDNLFLEKRPLEETLIIENIMEGEIEIPESFKVACKVKTNIT